MKTNTEAIEIYRSFKTVLSYVSNSAELLSLTNCINAATVDIHGGKQLDLSSVDPTHILFKDSLVIVKQTCDDLLQEEIAKQ